MALMDDNRLQRVGSGNRAFSITFFILRLLLGGLMFEAGLSKLLSGSFTAVGFLNGATGPFAGFYTAIAGSPTMLAITDVIVPWGELLIGIAIILGVVVRFASFWGIIMMLLYYTVSLPPANGWISKEIIYLVVFLNFLFAGAGYYLGLDRLAAGLEEKRHPLRILLG
jgi:thiosulfate dehydrogenase [quinone] large subunit